MVTNLKMNKLQKLDCQIVSFASVTNELHSFMVYKQRFSDKSFFLKNFEFSFAPKNERNNFLISALRI
jgi:hypothetical protein